MNADTVRRVGLSVAAPLLAVVLSVLITSVVLAVAGHDPVDTVQQMIDYAKKPRTQALILNSAVTYYFAALAVAFGFRMNLFNIGVDGQYRLAALLAAAVGGAVDLPPVLDVTLLLVVAVLVGGLWAAVAGLLKVYRGISEVISTIMLNSITTALIAYLLTTDKLGEQAPGSNNVGTPTIPAAGRVPGIDLIPDSSLQVYGLIVLAVVVGFLFWFVMERSRFGFELRATGRNEEAAVASGVNVKRMVLISMAISGGLAGLVGMPQLLGSSYTYSLDFPAGLGFTGIAIALLGRNTALGVAIGSLLFGFLDNSSQILDLQGVPKEIVMITQGVIVLSVVIAYELVRRYRIVAQQREVGRRLSEPTDPAGPTSTDSTPQGAQA